MSAAVKRRQISADSGMKFQGWGMADQPDPTKLKALGDKIDALKAAQEPQKAAQSDYAKAGQGWRMVIELVVGVIMGFGIGYGLDSLFGTLPIFLVLFILFGFAAGLRVMLQTAAEMDKKGKPPADNGPSGQDE